MVLKRAKTLILNSVGLGCLAGAIFLEVLVFGDILRHGYFLACEPNQLILAVEVLSTIGAIIYFVSIYQKFIRMTWKRQ